MTGIRARPETNKKAVHSLLAVNETAVGRLGRGATRFHRGSLMKSVIAGQLRRVNRENQFSPLLCN